MAGIWPRSKSAPMLFLNQPSADVDVSTICDGETDPFDHPILDHKERKVTPPDFRKDRQLALCQELLKPKYSVHGFKTADLKRTLNHFFLIPPKFGMK